MCFLWMYYRFKVCFSFACVQLVYSLSSTAVAASSNTIQRGDKACFLCCFGGVASMRETERARALLFCSEKKKVLKRKKSEGKERRCEQCQAKLLFFFCVLALRKLRRTVWREKVLHRSPHFSSSTIWFLALLYFLCLFHFRPSFLLSYFFFFFLFPSFFFLILLAQIK